MKRRTWRKFGECSNNGEIRFIAVQEFKSPRNLRMKIFIPKIRLLSIKPALFEAIDLKKRTKNLKKMSGKIRGM